MSFADPRESTAREDRYALTTWTPTALRIYAAGAFPMWDEAHDEIHLFRPDRGRAGPMDFTSPDDSSGRSGPARSSCRRIRRSTRCWSSAIGSVRMVAGVHRRWRSPTPSSTTEASPTASRHGRTDGSWGASTESASGASWRSRCSAGQAGRDRCEQGRARGDDEGLEQAGFSLFDVQFQNDHIARFGVEEISAEEYRPLIRRRGVDRLAVVQSSQRLIDGEQRRPQFQRMLREGLEHGAGAARSSATDRPRPG